MSRPNRQSLDTHARHIQQHGFRKAEPPALPPMPTQENVCRWCESPFSEHGFCPRGCAPNTDAPFTCQCAECGQTFRTGRAGAVLCWPCDDRERRQMASVKPLGTFKSYKALREDR